MKKKLLSLFLAICMIVPMTFSLVACGDEETPAGTEATKQSTIASDNIALSYTSTVYDGTKKEPMVVLKYGDSVVSSDNYTVTYLNNEDVGTATVIVTSNKGSEVLAEGLVFTTTFEIERAPYYVHNISELNAAILITDSNHVVKLGDNIALEKDEKQKVIPVLIYPATKDYDVAIDLAGFDINTYIDIRSTYNKVDSPYNAKINIFNSSTEESVIGATGSEINYALQLQSMSDFDVTLENVKFQGYWGGIATNGSAKYVNDKTSLTAKNCKFISTKKTALSGDDAGVGAYLVAGKYVYSFDTCEFEGFGGYYAKSGHHTLINCTVTAFGKPSFKPEHNPSGANVTGSALIVDSAEGYNSVPASGYQRGLTVDIVGGRFTSYAKYGLEEFCTYETERKNYAFIHITDDAIFEGAEGEYYIENDAMVLGLELIHHHTYNKFLSHNKNYHYEECYCRTVRNQAVHNWKYVETITEATFNTNGTKMYVCEDCGREETREYVYATDRTPIYVSTSEELNDAINSTDENHVIVLSNDIVEESINPIVIYPNGKNYNVAIDLAGYDLKSYIYISSRYKKVDTSYVATVYIFNSSDNESVVGAEDDSINYALNIWTNNVFNINVKNITFKAYWGGVATSGNAVSETQVNALNCKFIATKPSAVDGAGVGAYLVSAKHIFTFESCEFVGFGGYYTKNGHHNLINCTVRAVGTIALVPAYDPSGANQTGSALVIDSCEGYNKGIADGYSSGLTVNIVGGTYSSISKYAIEEYSTCKPTSTKICYATVTVSGEVELVANDSLSSSVNSQNGVIEGLN